MTGRLRWVPTKDFSEHLYGFHGAWLIAQVLHTDGAAGRHWRAYLSHRPVDDVRWASAEEAIAVAEAAWRLARPSGPTADRAARRRRHRSAAGRRRRVASIW
ncbi:hypothetical protein KSP35_06615 [Aquihabitans sp. G128]|uniref:hypothetical protein n=1 Tax=Aquihabitans sp. G128 TaxID=2849779 RepID=UPI001C244DDD|nr:hypothetical protein [Aquihabitans sp. G128]QXC62468.1 hypothetical protein KSP35_06615 [Aquihabitans sp. G128]